jgi:hypothetical protein
MYIEGNIFKMRTEPAEPVQYHLTVGSGELYVNELIGRELEFEYLGQINCIRCGRKTRISFGQGYCYPCFTTAPETSECVLKPELCRAHEGISRDMEWSQDHCLQEHVVYLAMTSGLKVGVTRTGQIPTRWIDQGAEAAIILARTPNRYTAGLVEIFLKKHMADKTNWKQMLTGKVEKDIDLRKEKLIVRDLLPDELSVNYVEEHDIFHIHYPVSRYPDRINNIDFTKVTEYTGELSGIKGQYLIFDDGAVLNIRKHGGFLVRIYVH